MRFFFKKTSIINFYFLSAFFFLTIICLQRYFQSDLLIAYVKSNFKKIKENDKELNTYNDIKRENIVLRAKIDQMNEYKTIFNSLKANFPVKALLNTFFISGKYHLDGSYLFAKVYDFQQTVEVNDIVLNKDGFFVGRVVATKGKRMEEGITNVVKVQLLDDEKSNIPVSSISNLITGIATGTNDPKCRIEFNAVNTSVCPLDGTIVSTYGYNSFPASNIIVGKIKKYNGKCCIINTAIDDVSNLIVINTSVDI